MFRIDLRRLILWLCLCSVLLTLGNSFYASYQVQRDILLEKTLENYRRYARQLAQATHNLLHNLQQELAYSAVVLADMPRHPEKAAHEIQRLLQHRDHFNTVFLVDTNGHVITLQSTLPSPLHNASPPLTNAPTPLHPLPLSNAATQQALQTHQPQTNIPYDATPNHWITLSSHPIFDLSGHYLGFIGGLLHLNENNVLRDLLTHQGQEENSCLYVIDRAGQRLYPAQDTCIDALTAANSPLTTLPSSLRGAQRLTTPQGIDMLVGYANVPGTDWTLVVQQPIADTLQRMNTLLWLTIRNTLPWLLILLLGIGWLSKLIARPLWELARAAKQMDDVSALEHIRAVKSWYFEASQLKRTLFTGLGNLNHQMRNLRRESTTDALTALLNRRGLIKALNDFTSTGVPFAVIMLDIDNFKSINDRHGHQVGDGVIRTLASLMRHGSRSNDILARTGGEEFTILLPNTLLEDAVRAAERLRTKMAQATNPTGACVTVSIGVARFPDHGNQVESLLKITDQALYHAKNNGRNLTCVVDLSHAQGLRLMNPPPH